MEVNEVEDIQDLNIESFVDHSQWECPIFIENEVDPMILITEEEDNDDNNGQGTKPVLLGFDKSMTERMLNCPLNALYVYEFVDKFKSFIDHEISLKSYRASLQTTNLIQKFPFTRRIITAAIRRK